MGFVPIILYFLWLYMFLLLLLLFYSHTGQLTKKKTFKENGGGVQNKWLRIYVYYRHTR